MGHTTLACAIEEMSINAWPSFRQVLMGGWVLRFADGYTFRSNSVQPIYGCDEDVSEQVRRCEAMYASMRLPCAFKVSPAVQPPDLDALLETSGYRVHTPTSVRVLGDLPEPIGDAGLSIEPLDAWIEAYSSVCDLSDAKRRLHAGIVERIPLPICTMVAREDGVPVACGLGVLQGDYVGLFDIHTAQSMRRMGLGTRVVRGILGWARGRGASKAYLQVVRDNSPAIALYDKLGFRHAYSYWYRVKDRA